MDSNVVLKLTEIDGAGNSTSLSTISASSSTITIGRSNEADIYFGEDDQTVSRRQFEVSFSGGAPTLKNTGRNPVLYKNGKKQLASGAQINIDSDVEFSFRESKLRLTVEVPAVYCLKTTGAGGRASFKVESDRKYTVGRSPDCDITLDSAGVSRRHCKIEIGAAEILTVHDLGSVNGVRLIIKGEVQEESSDIEVPCGDKFIIGDIECLLEKEGQGSAGKKKLVLPVVIVLLLLIAAAIYFVMNKDKSSVIEPPVVKPPVEEPPVVKPPVVKPPVVEPLSKLQQNINLIQEKIQADASYNEKAGEFAGLAKVRQFDALIPLCNQLAEYYSLCSTVKELNGSLPQKYDQQKEKTRRSIEQMKFDFYTAPSMEELKVEVAKLENEVEKLETSDKAVKTQGQQFGIQAPEAPDELTDTSDNLIKKVEDYVSGARNCSFIWTDLENSSFDSSKFDKEKMKMKASIDALYPEEGLGSEVCTKIEEIIAYQDKMKKAYKSMIGQISRVLTNYTKNGVSELLVDENVAMEDLRIAINIPRPNYFEEPPLITEVSSDLYEQLDGFSNKWTDLEFLAYCGLWRSDLEQRKKAFSELNEVIPFIDKLCKVALDKGMEPYREIKSRLESGEELGFNDADELIRIYDQCAECLKNTAFCELQKDSKAEMEAVSLDCLEHLYVRLKKECDRGLYDAQDAAETAICVQNAAKILEILDSAASLPPDFETRIQAYRDWVNKADKNVQALK